MALLSLASSFLTSRSNKSNQAANQRNLDLDRQLQKDFAQQGIRWRTEDAKAAGIHPLYAMGASIPTFSPSPSNIGGDTSLGPGLKSAGQDITRAITATQTRKQRTSGIAYNLSIERAQLENDLLRSRIALNTQTGPALPSALDSNLLPGQGDSSMDVQPMLINPSAPGRPHQETGAVADYGFARTATGLAPVPSLDVKERIEDQIIPEGMWALRNNLVPFASRTSYGSGSREGPNPKQFPLPPHQYWKWNRWKMEWQPATRGQSSWQRRPRAKSKDIGWGDVFTGS